MPEQNTTEIFDELPGNIPTIEPSPVETAPTRAPVVITHKTVTKGETRLLRVHITRDKTGVQLTLQSDLDLSRLVVSGPPAYTVCGQPCRAWQGNVWATFRPCDGEGNQDWTNGRTSNGLLIDRAYLNFEVLAAKDLKAGVTFVDTTLPYTSKKLEGMAKLLNEAMKWLWQNHFKPVEFKVELITKELV